MSSELQRVVADLRSAAHVFPGIRFGELADTIEAEIAKHAAECVAFALWVDPMTAGDHCECSDGLMYCEHDLAAFREQRAEIRGGEASQGSGVASDTDRTEPAAPCAECGHVQHDAECTGIIFPTDGTAADCDCPGYRLKQGDE